MGRRNPALTGGVSTRTEAVYLSARFSLALEWAQRDRRGFSLVS